MSAQELAAKLGPAFGLNRTAATVTATRIRPSLIGGELGHLAPVARATLVPYEDIRGAGIGPSRVIDAGADGGVRAGARDRMAELFVCGGGGVEECLRQREAARASGPNRRKASVSTNKPTSSLVVFVKIGVPSPGTRRRARIRVPRLSGEHSSEVA